MKTEGIVAGLVLLSTALATGPALARKNADPVASQQAARTTVLAPLTAGECKGLGGTVKDAATAACATGSRCVTVDKDGVMNSACITVQANP